MLASLNTGCLLSRWAVAWLAIVLNFCLPRICEAVEAEGDVEGGRSAQELVAYLAAVSKDLKRLAALPLNVRKAEQGYLIGITQGPDDQLFAVGPNGALLTRAAGAQWRQMNLPLDVTLTTVEFAANGVGWLGGHEGTIMRLDVNAEKWELVRTDPGFDGPILDFLFFNTEIGLALSSGGRILRTENGGSDWRLLELFTEDYFNPHLFSGLVLDDDHALIVGERGAVFKTADKGLSWTELVAPYISSLFGVLQLEGDEIIAYGITGHAFYSANGGASWVAVETGVSDSLFAHVRLGESLLLYGADGVALRLVRSDAEVPTVRQLPRVGRYSVSSVVNCGDRCLLAATSRGIQKIVVFDGEP